MLNEKHPTMLRVRFELTTSRLWDSRAANCAIEAWTDPYKSFDLTVRLYKDSGSPKQFTAFSPAGNWTPVSCVTGRDTDHYTTEDIFDHLRF